MEDFPLAFFMLFERVPTVGNFIIQTTQLKHEESVFLTSIIKKVLFNHFISNYVYSQFLC